MQKINSTQRSRFGLYVALLLSLVCQIGCISSIEQHNAKGFRSDENVVTFQFTNIRVKYYKILCDAETAAGQVSLSVWSDGRIVAGNLVANGTTLTGLQPRAVSRSYLMQTSALAPFDPLNCPEGRCRQSPVTIPGCDASGVCDNNPNSPRFANNDGTQPDPTWAQPPNWPEIPAQNLKAAGGKPGGNPADDGCPLPFGLCALFKKPPPADRPDASRAGIGDPVNPASGELFHQEVDGGFEAPGMDFRGIRTYRSQLPGVGMFGLGWTFLYERSIQFDYPILNCSCYRDNGILICSSSVFFNGAVVFERDGNGTRRRYSGGLAGNFSGGACNYELERVSGTPDPFTKAVTSWNDIVDPETGRSEEFLDIRWPNGVTYRYGANGKLASYQDSAGRTFQMGYFGGGGSLTTITDPVGRIVTFAYNERGLVETMAYPNGDTWQYGYDPDQPFLTSVEDPRGSITAYEYTTAGRLNIRRNAVGETQTWTYRIDNKVETYEGEQGKRLTFSYLENETVMTDGFGAEFRFQYDQSGNVTQTIERAPGGPDGELRTKVWTYEVQPGTGRMLTRTDPDGNVFRHEYDEFGALTKTIFPDLSERSFTYDPNFPTLVASHTLPDGGTTTFTRDSQGLMTAIEDSVGGTSSMTRGPFGLVSSVTDPTGALTNFDYDSEGNLTRITDPESGNWQMSHDAIGRTLGITDPLGRTTNFDYWLNDLVAVVTDALGQTQSFAFDALLRPSTRTDFDGTTAQFGYRTFDREGMLASFTDELGQSWTYEYDLEGKVVARVDPRGGRRSSNYDGFDNLVRAIGATGETLTYDYALDRTLRKVTDIRGNSTDYLSDGRQRPTERTNALGAKWTRGYDPADRITSLTDPVGSETKFTYDLVGRLTRTESPLNQVRIYEPDLRGQTRKITDERGKEYLLDYDRVGRLIKVIDPLAGEVTRTYDLAGQLISIQDEAGRIYAFEYDLLGRRSKMTAPDGGETAYTYTPTGEVETIADPNGHVRSFSYDALKRLTTSTDSLGNTRQYEYDPISNLTRVLDENSNPTTFEYDLEGRLLRIVDAAGQAEDREYDDRGQLSKVTNSRGQELTFEYDELGRMTKKTRPEDEEISGYDTLNRRTVSSNPTTTEMFEYDLIGRQTSMVDSRGFQSLMAYDLAGNPITRTDSRGRTSQITYDDLNRPQAITTARGSQYTYTYDPSGLMTKKTYPGGEIENRSFDAVGRVTRQEFLEEEGGALLKAYDYTYDLAGNRTAETETRTGGAQIVLEYEYNDRDELIRAEVTNIGGPAVKGWGRIDYTYDPAGNRLSRIVDGVSETYTHNNLNQVTARNGSAFVFDVDGNMLREALPNGDTRVNTYDSENNLVSTALETGGGLEDVFRYFYDADGFKLRVIEDPDASDPGKTPTILERFWMLGRVGEEVSYEEGGSVEDASWAFFAGLGFEVEEIEELETVAGNLIPLDLTFFYQDILGTTSIRQRIGETNAFNLGIVSENGPQEFAFQTGIFDVDSDGTKVFFHANPGGSFNVPGSSQLNVYLKDLTSGTIEAIGRDDTGAQPNRGVRGSAVAMSGDARFFLYISESTNLAPDGDRSYQIYRYDAAQPDANATIRITTNTSGNPFIGQLGEIDISDDGQRVLFEATATDLVASPPTGRHLYLWNQATGTISLADTSGTGVVSSGNSFDQKLSGDGGTLVFCSQGTNLVPGVTDSGQLYAKDIQSGAVELVSVNLTGGGANRTTSNPEVSTDGRYVVFHSDSTELVAGVAQTRYQVYLRDRTLGTTELISQSTAGEVGDGFISYKATLSDDGRFVAFASRSSNLTLGDDDGLECIFIRDRQTNQTIRYDVPASLNLVNFQQFYDTRLSNDGRYVVFRGPLNQLPDGPPLTTTTLIWRIQNPLHPEFEAVQRADLEWTPYGEKSAGPEVQLGLHGLRNEVRGDASGDGDETLLTMFRHARPRLGRWVKRDPGGMIDGPNRYLLDANNPFSFRDRNGLFGQFAGAGAAGGVIELGGAAPILGGLAEFGPLLAPAAPYIAGGAILLGGGYLLINSGALPAVCDLFKKPKAPKFKDKRGLADQLGVPEVDIHGIKDEILGAIGGALADLLPGVDNPDIGIGRKGDIWVRPPKHYRGPKHRPADTGLNVNDLYPTGF